MAKKTAKGMALGLPAMKAGVGKVPPMAKPTKATVPAPPRQKHKGALGDAMRAAGNKTRMAAIRPKGK